MMLGIISRTANIASEPTSLVAMRMTRQAQYKAAKIKPQYGGEEDTVEMQKRRTRFDDDVHDLP